jgi:hypothetical protein
MHTRVCGRPACARAFPDAGVALPTGLFVPSILCGAAYGRLVGVFVADLRAAPGVWGGSSIDEGTYALLGAASFLGGCAAACGAGRRAVRLHRGQQARARARAHTHTHTHTHTRAHTHTHTHTHH